MSRKLRPEEEALWGQVAASVKPLEKRVTPPDLPRLKPQVVAPAERAMPVMGRHQAATPPTQATLDAVWDRKIRTGEVLPDLIIDLHGHRRETAYTALTRGLARAHGRHARVVLVVTGKGKTGADWPSQPGGVLREELPRWLTTPDLRPYVAALRPAHPRHGGDGAWYVILKRAR
ncbi:Smr/MutS family protein [Parapedomonas caeni]|jgi:DNA-nicking Smr family endonuclease